MTNGPRILWSQLRIGVVVGLMTVAAAVTIFFADQVRDAFENRYTLYFHTFTTQSLRPRAPVWLAGQPVGHVVRLEFQPPTEGVGERLRVELSVRTEARPFILNGSVAQVVTAGLLGEAVVNIVPPLESAPQILDGGELPTASELDPFDQVRRLRAVYDSVEPVAVRWHDVLQISRSGTGTLPRLLQKPREMAELREQLDQLTGNLDAMDAVAAAVGSILADAEVRDALGRIDERLSRLAERWTSDDSSPAGHVLSPAFEARIARLEARISQVTQRLKTGRGSLGRLLNDHALAVEWKKTLAALAELRAELEAVAGRSAGAGN